MRCIVGLGNPGDKYRYTRHNIGFFAVDYFIAKYNFDYKIISNNKIKKAEIYEKSCENHDKIFVLKPMDYMNNSGQAINKLLTYYKIKPSDCIVIHDDIDIKLNQIKVKISGGNGGHNGLKSIDQLIGKEYYRIRCGIGRPENPAYEVADYVLSNFDKKTDDINLISSNVVNLIDLWLNNTDDFLKRKQIIC